MKFCCVFSLAAVAAFAFAVDYCSAYGYMDGLSCLNYGALGPSVVPAPALPSFLQVPMPSLPAKLPACGCNPSCLNFLKPCLHAKVLHLKKKLLEKKLAALLAHCTHYKNHAAF